MSESTGPHTFNLPESWRVGSAGRTMLGVKVKIDTPDEKGDGEVSDWEAGRTHTHPRRPCG